MAQLEGRTAEGVARVSKKNHGGRVEFEGAQAYPVGVDREGHHVGQVFDAEGRGRRNDVDAVLNAKQPDACKPGGDPEAARRAIAPRSRLSPSRTRHRRACCCV